MPHISIKKNQNKIHSYKNKVHYLNPNIKSHLFNGYDNAIIDFINVFE